MSAAQPSNSTAWTPYLGAAAIVRAISSASSGGAGPSSTAGRPDQAFVAAGVGAALMHGLTLATVPPGVTVRPLAERAIGSRTVDALTAGAGRSAVADDLLERLTSAARAYAGAR